MEGRSRIRVLIVTNNIKVGEGTRRLLEIFDNVIEVVGVARNGREAIEMARAFSPQVILMDTDMPKMDGFTATAHITQEMPAVQVVIMFARDDRHFMGQALRAGATDFVSRGCTAHEVYNAVSDAYQRFQQHQLQAARGATIEGGSRIRVLIVDDNMNTREGTRRLLEIYDEEIEVVGLATNGREAIEMARALSPQVILMETDMPVLDGFAATAHITQEMPAVQVIIVFARDDPHYMRQALRAGASDFVGRACSTHEKYVAVLEAYQRFQQHQLQATRGTIVEGGSRIGVMIVDDNIESLEGTRRLLEIYDAEIEVVGIARNGLEAIEMARTLSPHVILMEINMPEVDGLTVISHITREKPAIQVIIFTVQGGVDYMRAVLRAGVTDFIIKGCTADELYSAVLGAYRRWKQYQPPGDQRNNHGGQHERFK